MKSRGLGLEKKSLKLGLAFEKMLDFVNFRLEKKS